MAYNITDKCVGCGMCRKICPLECIEGRPRKRHKVDGDRCIDCGACGRICPHDAVLDNLGRRCERVRRRSLNWGKPLFDYDRCMSCRVCVDACPAACLGLTYTQDVDDRKAYPYLVDAAACIACRFCALECPVDAISMKTMGAMTDAEKQSLADPLAAPIQ